MSINPVICLGEDGITQVIEFKVHVEVSNMREIIKALYRKKESICFQFFFKSPEQQQSSGLW